MHHVIIGGGPAATNAMETIRQFESASSEITLVCDEPAHSRMALPYWLAGRIPREHTYTADPRTFEKLDVDARIGVRARRIDTSNRAVTLDDGSTIPFDRLLIATGSSPVQPRIPGLDLPGVQTMWSLADTAQALDLAERVNTPRVVMIGAGFVGLIVAGALFKRGWPLTIVEKEAHVLPNMLDDSAATLAEAWLKRQEVNVGTASTITAIADTPHGKQVELNDGTSLPADLVIVSAGVRPNLALIEGTPIESDQGILVNDHLETSISGVYAAGDVAQGPVLGTDVRAIHAIQPTAVDHGRIAGANMAGADIGYEGSLSMNVLDVCGLQCVSYGSFGDIDGDCVVTSDPARCVYRKLVFRNRKLTGALLTGPASDVGLLSDIGMVKGLIQTGVDLGIWQDYLSRNPHDLRRPFVALNVASQLARTTLLGSPARARAYRFENRQPETEPGEHHGLFLETR